MGVNIRSKLMSWPPCALTVCSVADDGMKLFHDFEILAENLVELGALAHQADPDFSSIYRRSVVSLAKVVEHYTAKELDKGPARMSNWECVPLTEEQQECGSYSLLDPSETQSTGLL